MQHQKNDALQTLQQSTELPALHPKCLALPAKPEILAAAVDKVLLAVDTLDPANNDHDKHHIEKLCLLIGERDYTAAEMAFAVNALIEDEALTSRLGFPGNHVELSDFAKHIKILRRVKDAISIPQPMREINTLMKLVPGQLQANHFHYAGDGPFSEPVWRYNPDIENPRPWVPGMVTGDSSNYHGPRTGDVTKASDHWQQYLKERDEQGLTPDEPVEVEEKPADVEELCSEHNLPMQGEYCPVCHENAGIRHNICPKCQVGEIEAIDASDKDSTLFFYNCTTCSWETSRTEEIT